jgi:hypothetical protein
MRFHYSNMLHFIMLLCRKYRKTLCENRKRKDHKRNENTLKTKGN